MSKHTTYRGLSIDMDSMRRENEKVPALGNMGVNAKGDKVGRNGTVTKTADQIARENHRVQTAVIKTGIKGPAAAPLETTVESKPVAATTSSKTTKKIKETELPNGDIQIEEEKE